MSIDPSRDASGEREERPLVEQMMDDVASMQPGVVDDLDAEDIRAIEPEQLTGSVVATIAVLVVAAFVAMLMETALGVALPAVMADLHIPVDIAQWLTTGFLLTMAVVIPTTGFLMQRLRTRTLFSTGMAIFAVGTLFAAIAPTFALLLVGRVMQAAGTAVIMPQLMAVTLASVPLRFRGTVMGFNTVVIMGAPALGPTLSGLVIDTLGWRWLFWFVLPIAVVVMVTGFVVLRTDGETRKVPLDLLSVLLALIGFGGLIYAMASVRPVLEGDWLPVVLGTAGVLGLIAFIWRQLRLSRRGAPLLDLSTFRVRNFRIGIIMATALFATLFGSLIVLPIHLQLGMGVTAVVTGLVLLPGPVLQGVLAPLIGRLSDAVDPRPLVIPGTILLATAVFAMTTLRMGVPLTQVVIINMTMSLGMALIFTPMLTSTLGALPKELYGHGAATLNTMQQLAGAAGAGLIVAIMSVVTTTAAAGGLDAVAAQTRGSQVAFLVSGAVALIAMVCAFLLRPVSDPEPLVDGPVPDVAG